MEHHLANHCPEDAYLPRELYRHPRGRWTCAFEDGATEGVEPLDWAENLRTRSGLQELERLAKKSEEAAKEVEVKKVADTGDYSPTEPPGKKEKASSSSSRSSQQKKKKKKKKTKKGVKVSGTKSYEVLFKHIGMDPDPRVRQKIARLAKRAMKRKGKASSSGHSSDSSGTSSTGELGHLFEESQRTQLAARAGRAHFALRP